MPPGPVAGRAPDGVTRSTARATRRAGRRRRAAGDRWPPAPGGASGPRRRRSPDALVAVPGEVRATGGRPPPGGPLRWHRWPTTRPRPAPVSYTHLRAHETDSYLVCRLL